MPWSSWLPPTIMVRLRIVPNWKRVGVVASRNSVPTTALARGEDTPTIRPPGAISVVLASHTW